MKKIILKSIKLDQEPPIVVNNVENVNKNIDMYLARKTMQTSYQELFKALLRLPDRQVQKRVLDAINGSLESSNEIIQTCDICKEKRLKRCYVDAATQTTTTALSTKTISRSNFTPSDSDDSRETSTPTDNSKDIKKSSASTLDESKGKKRKQRRKIRAPQVIKKSHIKEMQKRQPVQNKRKTEVSKPLDNDNNANDEKVSTNKRFRSDSVCSIDIIDALQCIESLDSMDDYQTRMKDVMTKEISQAEVIQSDGLIPIHSAIMNSDLLTLKRQIFVWQKFKKVDINELCTEDDEDCLQLAIVQNKPDYIVKVLIENDLDLNSLDTQSNTLLHLAVLNNVDVDVLELLLKKIDLNMLLKFNDDGFTPLHLTIREDNFLQAEVILNMLDERFYKRENKSTKEDFLNFYEKQCESFTLDNSILQRTKEKQYLKRRLIDTGEMRSGNTALFCAIENNLEHLIYFLLAHLANPCIENHSGQTSRAYLGEFAKTLNLSLKIDRVMEQVESFLKK